jgi:hypothetical protein
MGKVDIRVSLQPTEVFIHASIFLKVYIFFFKLIDNVKMAFNLWSLLCPLSKKKKKTIKKKK